MDYPVDIVPSPSLLLRTVKKIHSKFNEITPPALKAAIIYWLGYVVVSSVLTSVSAYCSKAKGASPAGC